MFLTSLLLLAFLLLLVSLLLMASLLFLSSLLLLAHLLLLVSLLCWRSFCCWRPWCYWHLCYCWRPFCSLTFSLLPTSLLLRRPCYCWGAWVDLNPMPESTLFPSLVLWIWPLSAFTERSFLFLCSFGRSHSFCHNEETRESKIEFFLQRRKYAYRNGHHMFQTMFGCALHRMFCSIKGALGQTGDEQHDLSSICSMFIKRDVS